MSVFPNPAQNEIHCVLPENSEYELYVYDLSGKLIRKLCPEPIAESSTEFIQRNAGLRLTTGSMVLKININELSPGIYFIEARGEKVLLGSL